MKRSKGLTYSSDGTITNSLFQEIAAGRVPPSGSPQILLHTDAACVIFSAKNGESGTHLLVVPHRIIKSWCALVQEGPGKSSVELSGDTSACTSACTSELRGKALLEHMKQVALRYTSSAEPLPNHPYPDHIIQNPINLQMGFHTPPFNSIDHLHLHVIDRSKMHPGLKAHKFPVNTWTPWFKPLQEVFKEFDVKETESGTRGKDAV
jgi:hypothetical protein